MELNIMRGYYLRMLRKQEGLSLRQAAELAGISSTYLRNLEHGKYHISLDHAHAIMKLYGGSLDFWPVYPMKGIEMHIIELTALCLLAKKNPPKYPSELIHTSGGILKHPYTYVLLNNMHKKGLVEKHFENSADQFNSERPFYIITVKGKLKLEDFLKRLGLVLA